MRAPCHYCDEPAIGFELEYFERATGRINVCRDCAHQSASVNLFSGGTWVKRAPRPDAPVEGETYRLTGGPDDPCIANGDTWEDSKVDGGTS